MSLVNEIALYHKDVIISLLRNQRLLAQHNQESARLSPDPFVVSEWDQGTRLPWFKELHDT